MKKEKHEIGVEIGLGIRAFFVFLGKAIGAVWCFLIHNLERIIKIIVLVWGCVLVSILVLSLSYWLLGLGSNYFLEAGEKIETLDMEKILTKYPDLQILLEEVRVDSKNDNE